MRICARRYDCLFPAMIKSWRRAFKVPHAYFGFVQLASWMQARAGPHCRVNVGEWLLPKIVNHCGIHSTICTSFATSKRKTCGKTTTHNRVNAGSDPLSLGVTTLPGCWVMWACLLHLPGDVGLAELSTRILGKVRGAA